MPEAVIFDLDGLLLESEQVWNASSTDWPMSAVGPGATRPSAMLGMSSPEWSRYMHDELRVPLEPDDLGRGREADDRVLRAGAAAAARRGRRGPARGRALAAGTGVLLQPRDHRHGARADGWASLFAVTVSSEEVERGKPEPDVYLEAARRLQAEPDAAWRWRTPNAGIRSALAAGLGVVAVPNAYPPDPEVLERANVVLDSLDELDGDAIERGAAK